MKLGYCHLTVIPCRKQASDTSEMVTQLLFGEPYEILEEEEKWTRIVTFTDKYECWVSNNQIHPCQAEVLQSFTDNCPTVKVPLVPALHVKQGLRVHLTFGAYLHTVNGTKFSIGTDEYELIVDPESTKDWTLDDLIFKFLNTPYLWGGKSLFGIDCSGLTQVVSRILGKNIPRDAYQQAEIGTSIDFNSITTGDLVFFENKSGKITHVGIALDHERIAHASGKVRIDSLDNRGIFDKDQQRYTHAYKSAVSWQSI